MPYWCAEPARAMKRGQHKFSECAGRQGQDGGVSAAGGAERSGVRRERRSPGGFESGQGAAQARLESIRYEAARGVVSAAGRTSADGRTN